MKYEHRILIWGLLTGLVGSVVSLLLLWKADYTTGTQLALTLLILIVWLGFTIVLKARIIFPLRTLSNLLGALREGDYSLQARGARRNDALGELIWEINALAKSLREQRLGTIEATALLRKIMAEIDVAMFGFDNNRRLQLINNSGRHLLGRVDEKLLGCHIDELGLADCLDGPTPRVVDLGFPGGVGRWELRKGSYREEGLSHQLLFLSDLTRALHEEERLAWKRLLQILRHEIDNSLTPIQSVAQSLQSLLSHKSRPDDWEEDVHSGLQIVAERSETLHRFIKSYSQLTHLPKPKASEVDVETLVRHVAGLETRMAVSVVVGPEVVIRADRDQLQLESNPNGDGQVLIGWQVDSEQLQVWIEDDGPGLDETKDAFVPFYTTKPHGSGIGLTLSRQIAEVHDGSLTLENHRNKPGCRACLCLPLE
jgi:nitrogen fixation/metabolism regulation signal transduction histidine kinase